MFDSFFKSLVGLNLLSFVTFWQYFPTFYAAFPTFSSILFYSKSSFVFCICLAQLCLNFLYLFLKFDKNKNAQITVLMKQMFPCSDFNLFVVFFCGFIKPKTNRVYILLNHIYQRNLCCSIQSVCGQKGGKLFYLWSAFRQARYLQFTVSVFNLEIIS